MVKISEYAQAYESKATKNIADLDKVQTNLELIDDEFEFKDAEGNDKKVKQKVVVVENEKYRVPVSVIQQLKVMLEDNKDLKHFKVKKTGESKDNTRYTVIPLSD